VWYLDGFQADMLLQCLKLFRQGFGILDICICGRVRQQAGGGVERAQWRLSQTISTKVLVSQIPSHVILLRSVSGKLVAGLNDDPRFS